MKVYCLHINKCAVGITVIAFNKQWYNGNLMQENCGVTPLPRVASTP